VAHARHFWLVGPEVAAVDFTQSTKPDLIISDAVMLYMSGIEVAIQIRGFLPACKIILFRSGRDGGSIRNCSWARVRILRFLPNLFIRKICSQE
jgi:CheY-like chemotaxis protein